MIKYSIEDIDKLNLNDLINKTAETFPNSRAIGFVGKEDISYKSLHHRIHKLAHFLKSNGINQGDKVSVWSTNSPNWVISYFSIIKIGAIAVPVLPDFTAEEAFNIYKESGAKSLFISKANYKKLKSSGLNIDNVICIDDFSYRFQNGEEIKNGKTIEDFTSSNDFNFSDKLNAEIKPDDIASIIFTSGTTGNSKGVILSHKNLIANLISGSVVQEFNNNDKFLSVLPIAHTYEFTLGCLIPLAFGSSIYYLEKPPTASVLLPALNKVKPTTLLSVPLIIEKVYKNKIKPALFGNFFKKTLMLIPGINSTLYKIAGKKLYKSFGDNLKFFGIGGAKLNPEVEKFLYKSNFPYSIGYGLTETAPLLAGNPVGEQVLQSTGKAVKAVDIKIINKDKKTKEGEIVAKGPNVMKSYYKRPELSKEVFTDDGYFKTGDLGYIDKNKNLHIRGRIKNMILGPGGENIYPEEIESKINQFDEVLESLVYEAKGKIIAKVVLNHDVIEKKMGRVKLRALKFENDLNDFLDDIKFRTNRDLNKFSKLNLIEIQEEPFERTPTNKIKRYLYT